MPMIENRDRLKLRVEAKDFIVGAGSPVTGSQITNALGTNNHMTDRIIGEFREAGFVKPFYLGANTENPITAWEMTPILKRINEKEFKEKLSEITKIEKPRDDKK